MRNETEVREMLEKVKRTEGQESFLTVNYDRTYGIRQALAWVLGDAELAREFKGKRE